MTTQAKAPKLFTLAYVTSHPTLGTKLRFGNVDRTAILVREGHDPIRYVKLSDEPVTKQQLATLIKDHADFQDELAQTAIMEFIGKSAPKPAKETKAAATEPAAAEPAAAEPAAAEPAAAEPAAAEPAATEQETKTKGKGKGKAKAKDAEPTAEEPAADVDQMTDPA